MLDQRLHGQDLAGTKFCDTLVCRTNHANLRCPAYATRRSVEYSQQNDWTYIFLEVSLRKKKQIYTFQLNQISKKFQIPTSVRLHFHPTALGNCGHRGSRTSLESPSTAPATQPFVSIILGGLRIVVAVGLLSAAHHAVQCVPRNGNTQIGRQVNVRSDRPEQGG